MTPKTAATSAEDDPGPPEGEVHRVAVLVAVLGVDDAVGVLRLVLLGVLHEDAVGWRTVVGALGEVALEHDGEAGLEQVGRVALGGRTGDDDAVEGRPSKVTDVAVAAPTSSTHEALEAEAAGAEVVALGDGLVGVAEVERGVAEALEHDEADADDDDGRARPRRRSGRRAPAPAPGRRRRTGAGREVEVGSAASSKPMPGAGVVVVRRRRHESLQRRSPARHLLADGRGRAGRATAT